MTAKDLEIERWMADWQAVDVSGTPPLAMRNYVRRRSRLLKAWVASEFVVGLGGLAFIVITALAVDDRIHRSLMFLLALGVTAALVFSWWNWRGTLRVSGHDTATFMTLSMERLRRVRRAVRASWAILAVQIAVFTPWIWHQLYNRGAAPTLRQQVVSWGLLVGLSAAAAVWTFLADRWANRDARVLHALARELGDEEIR